MKKNSNRLMSDVQKVFEALDITPIRPCKHLIEWEKAEGIIKTNHAETLEGARQNLNSNYNLWNDEEMKMKFVCHLLHAAQIDIQYKIGVFYRRRMEGTAKDKTFNLICDCMVATATNANQPALPYFFFQEFNRAKANSIDPEALMLVAMLLAQAKSNDGKPIYGAYQQGKNWYFSVLDGDNYCLGTQFDATVPASLAKIVYMLQALKGMILGR